MKWIFSFGKLKEYINGDKRIKLILILGIAVIILIALSGLNGRKAEAVSTVSADELYQYEKKLEERLTDILTQIDGVGKIKVMVTLDTSEENEYGKTKDVLLSVKAPSVRGVIVVCDGGDNIIVKEKVTSAVSGVFGISTTRVSVIN